VASHRWSLLCYRACVDKYSNVLSILDVTEELTLEPLTLEPLEETPENAGLPVHVNLVSVWGRSDPSKAEKFWQAVTIVTPKGEEISAGTLLEGDLENHRRTRLIFQIPVLPFAGFGTYWFVISAASEPDAPPAIVDRVPLEVLLKPTDPYPTLTEQPSEPTPPVAPESA
jgi:hypothetical protein